VTLAEPSILLSITYSASLKETHCELTHYPDGSWYFRVGNFVNFYVVPASGRTVQQYVGATRTPYETVTLTPIAGVHAQEAYLVEVQLAADAPGPGYFNNKGIVALLRGSQYIYEVAEIQAGEWPVTTDNVIPNSQHLSDFIPGFAVT
jgi:hypothetical protein